MFLKTLTLKGFKSFAEPTTLELEPGVTVVVGPNGSGKSNVVDAIAWVLGAQGPKVVRSQKMEDVIFAGTGKRSALGRAEVSLTIDNSQKLLPVDLTEVTISRTLFRSGDSEYALNGLECRLLDIQELLSDSGVGRTQHVIVSQGQLDWVLNARPEDRRSIIEEAAGVLKYRKRREKAERRLEATESDLQRLGDLVGEVRRSIRPLERQAEAAKKFGDLDHELRELRLFIAGRDLEDLSKSRMGLEQRAGELRTKESSLVLELRKRDDEVAALEGALDRLRLSDLSPVIGDLSAIRERAMGLSRIIEEKKISVEKVHEANEAKSHAVRRAQSELCELKNTIEEVSQQRVHVVAREQQVRADLVQCDAQVSEAERHFRISESDHQRWIAKREALETAMRQARAKAGAEQVGGVPGVLGALAELVDIDEGWELAFEAAVGEISSAVIVAGLAGVKASLEKLAELPEGGAVYMAPSRSNTSQASAIAQICSQDLGLESLMSHVRVTQSVADPGPIYAVLDSLISKTVVDSSGWSHALGVSLDNDDLCVVTKQGDRFEQGNFRVGTGGIGASKAALDYAQTQEVQASRDANDKQTKLDSIRRDNLAIRASYDQVAKELTRIDEQKRLLEDRYDNLARETENYQERFEFQATDGGRTPSESFLTGGLGDTGEDVLDRIKRAVGEVVEDAEVKLAELGASRSQVGVRLNQVARQLEETRRSRHEAERSLTVTRELLQKGELDLAENTLRGEMAVEALRRDLDCEPEFAMACQCPGLPPGMTAKQRARELERELKLLGPINPLALEELTTLQERYEFLSTQIEDIKSARRDLMKVLRAIDEEIQAEFAMAFEDVSSNFTALFATLFPGGLGKLILTDPTNLLETGIEIEAKPPGKNVKKLSLLSGGERSLVALAYLFAVFRSRPSPFYVLDEVEAALDDANLTRFLDLVNEFRQEAQLIIVSHQKRTMEQADSLYGVSMAPGGSSKVLSERLRKSA